jgi:hypothetical protein
VAKPIIITYNGCGGLVVKPIYHILVDNIAKIVLCDKTLSFV